MNLPPPVIYPFDVEDFLIRLWDMFLADEEVNDLVGDQLPTEGAVVDPYWERSHYFAGDDPAFTSNPEG